MGPLMEGIDLFTQNPLAYCGKKRCAILAHGASVDSSMEHIVSLAIKGGVNIVKIFSPEHGLFGAAQDMESVNSHTYMGIEVVSLYGNEFSSLSIEGGQFDGIDLLICDLRDVGSRYYTYVWTIYLAVERAIKAGVETLILDRINPIGGTEIEGNIQDPEYLSFVGLYPIPVRHGLTVGELVTHTLNVNSITHDSLSVLPVKGYKRSMKHGSDFRWVMPSPNMPTPSTALIYPGLCLLEGTNISEGRGTTKPFEIFGAPFIDGDLLASELKGFLGVDFRSLKFKPMFQKFAGELCGGVEIHVSNEKILKPWALGIYIIEKIMKLWPDEFEWRKKAYEFVEDIPAIDLLAGSGEMRRLLEKGESCKAIVQKLSYPAENWWRETDSVLLYST
jgi:uncharacterized protein YbbC (DUF1343 family)